MPSEAQMEDGSPAPGPALETSDHPAAMDEASAHDAEGRWHFMLRRLLEFKAAHGHTKVTRKWKGDPKLAGWVLKQRRLQIQGRLRPDWKQQLDAAGFLWTHLMPHGDDLWEKRFGELVAFWSRHDHTRVTKQWQDSPGLSSWCFQQRLLRRKGKLSPDRAARLDELGFAWDVSGRAARSMTEHHENRWNSRFAELLKFKERFGHCNVPAGWKEDADLAGWVLNQRELANQGALRPDRRERLEQTGFVWKSEQQKQQYLELWELRFAELKAFKERFGHSNVPKPWAESRPLGNWVDNQRAFRRRGALSEDRIRRLDEIGFVWRPREQGR